MTNPSEQSTADLMPEHMSVTGMKNGVGVDIKYIRADLHESLRQQLEASQHRVAELEADAFQIQPVAHVVEQLDGNEARILWLFNPVMEGGVLLWHHQGILEPECTPIDAALSQQSSDKPSGSEG